MATKAKRKKKAKTKRIDVSALSVAELLQNYGAILDELRHRKIVRSANNPLSDYAEYLFCTIFRWQQLQNSSSGHDAVDKKGNRYQIKARRLHTPKGSRQLSAIRNLKSKPFDFLAGLLVDREFQILRAAIIPIAIIRKRSVHVRHTNSWKFLLRDEIWRAPGVRDVTMELTIMSRVLNTVSRH
jgi:hypothetical protein